MEGFTNPDAVDPKSGLSRSQDTSFSEGEGKLVFMKGSLWIVSSLVN